jgi:effector-binding domain-containing protein
VVYTVGQLARICGISAKTLRHYDAEGLFSPAEVGPDNRYRYYAAAQLPVLRRIVFLRNLGIGVDPLKHLKATGALDDPEKLEAALTGRAETASQEISSLESLLDRIQFVLARMRAEGEVPDMGQYEVGVKQVPAMEVVSVRKTIPLAGIGELFGEAFRKLRARPAGPPVAIYHDPEFDPEKADIEVAVPVAARGTGTLPAAEVAFVTHVGPYSKFGEVYQALTDWLQANGRQMSGPPREIYLVGPESKRPESEYVTEVQFPVG